jgi:hypothetical protein
MVFVYDIFSYFIIQEGIPAILSKKMFTSEMCAYFVGDCTSLIKLVEKLPHNIYGLQCSADVPLDSISSMAAYYIQVISTELPF